MLDVEKFTFFPPEKLLSGSGVIPSKSGIYAWYLDFSKFQHINSKEEFHQKITTIDTLISKDCLTGSVKSFFRKYDILMQEKRVFLEKFIIDDVSGVKTVGEKLDKLTLQQCKDILKNLSKFSMLVSPLYIGIASSLKDRHIQHKKAFDNIKLLQSIGENPEKIIIEAEKKFGGRAAIRGFNWEYLIFACAEMDVDRKSIQEQEYLLNRFFNPILGRR